MAARKKPQKKRRLKRVKGYRVVWEIDVEATTAKEAAQRAREIQQDPDSTATFFTVSEEGGDSILIELA